MKNVNGQTPPCPNVAPPLPHTYTRTQVHNSHVDTYPHAHIYIRNWESTTKNIKCYSYILCQLCYSLTRLEKALLRIDDMSDMNENDRTEKTPTLTLWGSSLQLGISLPVWVGSSVLCPPWASLPTWIASQQMFTSNININYQLLFKV